MDDLDDDGGAERRRELVRHVGPVEGLDQPLRHDLIMDQLDGPPLGNRRFGKLYSVGGKCLYLVN